MVEVEGHAGDAGKVTASGPGLEPEGVVVGRPTYFDIFTKGIVKEITQEFSEQNGERGRGREFVGITCKIFQLVVENQVIIVNCTVFPIPLCGSFFNAIAVFRCWERSP